MGTLKFGNALERAEIICKEKINKQAFDSLEAQYQYQNRLRQTPERPNDYDRKLDQKRIKREK